MLRDLDLRPDQIDLVALAGTRVASRTFVNEAVGQSPGRRDDLIALLYPRLGRTLSHRARQIAVKLHLAQKPKTRKYLPDGERQGIVSAHVGGRRIMQFDHHTCHAATAYFGSPYSDCSALVLTADGSGDGTSATVSRGADRGLDRLETTRSATGSLGTFYSFVTQLLGMKPLEDEFKVMGLAAYASEAASNRAAAALGEVFEFIEGRPCRFAWKGSGPRYRRVLEATLGLRFDAIAGGAQQLTEETLLQWARLMWQRYGEDCLALSGGVFMNVRANMRLAEEEWVRQLFIVPSCGDESNAMGAAYLGYARLCEERRTTPGFQPLDTLYLGPAVRDDEIETLVRERNVAAHYRVSVHDRIDRTVAELLASSEVVGRCAGRMEFGARALGNRLILANPSDPRMAPLINQMIKNRDFWMPFAPTILAERAGEYLLNPKGLTSPHMMLTFRTRTKGRTDLIGASHPHDGTVRAQILERAHNPEYYDLIADFERRTGIGAVLNTSFNLHGEPIVCSAADAFSTFERSGLQHLALGHWLISKR